MNREDVLSLLRRIQNKEQYIEVRESIRDMDEAELFYSLFFVAVGDLYSTPAGWAAALLRELNPRPQISCEEAIRAMLGELDPSGTALPFYIFEQFGKTAVDDALRTIQSSRLTGREKADLGTVKYWTDIAANSDSAKSPNSQSALWNGAFGLAGLYSTLHKLVQRRS